MFWECLIFGIRPSKISIFSGSDPERLERGPQCLARRKSFQKPLRTTYCSSPDWLQSDREKWRLLPISAVSRAKNTSVFAQLRVVSGLGGREPWSLGGGVILLNDSSDFRPIADLKLYHFLFENFSYEPRYGGVSAGLWRQNQRNGPF